MAFLTRDKVRSVEELRDIRLILIEELRRRFPGTRRLRVSGCFSHSFQRKAGFARQRRDRLDFRFGNFPRIHARDAHARSCGRAS